MSFYNILLQKLLFFIIVTLWLHFSVSAFAGEKESSTKELIDVGESEMTEEEPPDPDVLEDEAFLDEFE